MKANSSKQQQSPARRRPVGISIGPPKAKAKVATSTTADLASYESNGEEVLLAPTLELPTTAAANAKENGKKKRKTAVVEVGSITGSFGIFGSFDILFYLPAFLVLIGTAIWHFNDESLNERFEFARSFCSNTLNIVIKDWSLKLSNLLKDSSSFREIFSYFWTNQCSYFVGHDENVKKNLMIKRIFGQLLPYFYAGWEYWGRLSSNASTNIVVIISFAVDCYLYDVYIADYLFASTFCNILAVQLIIFFMSWSAGFLYTIFVRRILARGKFLTTAYRYHPSNIYFCIIGAQVFFAHCKAYANLENIQLLFPELILAATSAAATILLILFIKEWIVSSYIGGFKHFQEWFVNVIHFHFAAILAGLVTIFIANALIYNFVITATEAVAAVKEVGDAIAGWVKGWWS
jgi:hypothetical protein